MVAFVNDQNNNRLEWINEDLWINKNINMMNIGNLNVIDDIICDGW